MNNPFAMTPEALHQELMAFNARLQQGLDTLYRSGDIEAGASAREAVYEEDKLSLYHYQVRTEKQNPVPVLIVYALVNRPYMADLQEDRSLIRGLLDAGLDVYLLDWGRPDKADSFITLDDYICGYLDRCVDVIRDKHSAEKINLLGICQGGTFGLCYTALYQDKINTLITTVTPVDFHTDKDLLSRLVRHVDVDLCVDTLGNIPGEFLNWSFLLLKPFQLMGQKYIELVQILDDVDKVRNFMCMEKWRLDSPAQAGEAYRRFITEFYQENKLIKGQVRLAGRPVDLETLTLPILNIYARDDHLVPPDSSKALAGCIGSDDYTEMAFPGGHIGIYVSSQSRQLLPSTISTWLAERGA